MWMSIKALLAAVILHATRGVRSISALARHRPDFSIIVALAGLILMMELTTLWQRRRRTRRTIILTLR